MRIWLFGLGVSLFLFVSVYLAYNIGISVGENKLNKTETISEMAVKSHADKKQKEIEKKIEKDKGEDFNFTVVKKEIVDKTNEINNFLLVKYQKGSKEVKKYYKEITETNATEDGFFSNAKTVVVDFYKGGVEGIKHMYDKFTKKEHLEVVKEEKDKNDKKDK